MTTSSRSASTAATPGSEANGAPLLVIVGPTGTGKSALSLDVVEALGRHGRGAEIVNADAMQLYRGMDIGTAKLTVAERRGIPHHLLDVLDPSDDATVAWYQHAARRSITEIVGRGNVPVLVGGSGLYVSAVIHDLRFPGSDPGIRAALEQQLERDGVGALYARLRSLDPVGAASVDPANPRRVVRALEVLELTGEPQRTTLPSSPTPWMPHRIIALRSARETLVARLDARVRGMWADGLVAEAAALIPRGIDSGVTAARAIGYAQALAQHRGLISEHEAIAQAQALTRRYARRQMSWFRRYADASWMDVEQTSAADRTDAAVAAQLGR